MIMHTPPEGKGQIIEVSYGYDTEYAYRRICDRSDGTESWDRISWDDWPDNMAFEPWNREPSVEDKDWEKCEKPEVV